MYNDYSYSLHRRCIRINGVKDRHERSDSVCSVALFPVVSMVTGFSISEEGRGMGVIIH